MTTTDTGTLTRHASFESRHVAARHVDVWRPPGYAEGPARRHPVLYMHDGQNLFDPATAYGGQTWGVREAMLRLMARGEVRPALIVGIWNTGSRWREYMPQKPYFAPEFAPHREAFLHTSGGEPFSDRYLQFLTQELKPFIDSTYRTEPGRAHTFVMGSSMGGLISLYAICEYPDVFGGAACLSTHWPAGGDPLVDALASALPDPAGHRLYFDFGTETLDSTYEPYQRRMDARLSKVGYSHGENWLTRKFEGAEHNEKSWRARVEIPLAFLLAGRAHP